MKRKHKINEQRAMLVNFAASALQTNQMLTEAVNRFHPSEKGELLEALGLLFGLVQLMAIVAEIDADTLQAETLKYLEDLNNNPLNN